MNATLIANWNEVVSVDDDVWHLGDVGMDSRKLVDIIPRLNGNKYLILGNHDGSAKYMQGLGFLKVYQSWKLKVGTKTVALQHRPRPLTGYDQGRWQISGHAHNSTPHVDYENKIVNCSVEWTNYRPITEAQVIKLITSTR